MMKKIFYAAMFLAAATSARAELSYQGGSNPNWTQQQYFNAAYPEYQQSVIYVFYNSQTCYNCPQTIALVEQVYDQYFQDQYQFFVIDYFSDDEYNFMQVYQLDSPVSMVLQRVADGQPEGFRKYDNLQNLTSDPESFQAEIKFEIESFLNQ